MKQPLFARVVVQPVPIEKIQGGVHIPDSVNTRPIEGHVIATGPLVTYVKVGEKVYYSKYAGQDMRTEINGKTSDVVVIEERDLLGHDPIEESTRIEPPEPA